MCKHILNAQVSIRAPCCKRWFDCPECHLEAFPPPTNPSPSNPSPSSLTTQNSHPLLQSFEMTFACKKCKKCFRKDAREMEDADEYCPFCDNHFVLDAVMPKAELKVESEDVRVDARMLRDERVKGEEGRSIFDVKDAAERLG